MKKTLMVCWIVLAAFAGALWLKAQKPSGPEQEVAALEAQWLKAQKTSNPDLLAPLLAEKFVNTSTDSVVTEKAATLAIVKSSKWSAAEYKDVKVTVLGDTAIATGIFQGKGTDGTGKSVEVNERWTDTWVKLSKDNWQCLASHASPIKK